MLDNLVLPRPWWVSACTIAVPYVLNDGFIFFDGVSLNTMYFYKQTFVLFQGGYGAALAWAMFIVIFADHGAAVLPHREVLGALRVRGAVMTAVATPAESSARHVRAKEPTTTYRQLDRRTCRFVMGSLVTAFGR